MKRFALLSLLVLSVLPLTACGARGSTSVAHFARAVGVGTAYDINEGAHRVFALHQFEIERQEDEPSLYLETRWRDRMPFEDEQGLGVTAAQVRAVMRGRPRSGTSALGTTYSVDLSIEQRVQTMTQEEWTSLTATPQARAYAERIAEDLRRELDVGVRRF